MSLVAEAKGMQVKTETETKINVELLRTAVNWVEQQAKLPTVDREWDQGEWVVPSEIRLEELSWEAAMEHWRREHAFESVYREWPNSSELKPEFAQILAGIMDNLAPRCGSAYCVAGYIAQRADKRYADSEVVDGLRIEDFAQSLLGISSADADRLFDGDNDASRIRVVAEEIAGTEL